MPLGIKPIVDFAFKKIFGSPQNSAALIGLLNAILELQQPIVAVEVLNPFSYQEFAESKLIVLDLRCRDNAGRMLNVEMQASMIRELLERMVYYASSMYVEQLTVGDNYAKLRPAISICLLTQRIFDSSQPHHRFQMVDLASGRQLNEAIEVHTVELGKYNLEQRTISQATKIEQWAFLMLYAQDYDSLTLKKLLPGIEFEQAIETIEVISAKTEDRIMYDQREKAQRDYEWAITGAREEGLEKGRQEGREEGLKKGKLAGKIQMLQELLGDTSTTDAEFQSCSIDALTIRLAELQQRLRARQV
jgi:predicted transposase/invertase (TIGR01784 family)